MKTPEAKVKAEIKKILKRYEVWHFIPVSNGLGAHGIPDFICCVPLTIRQEMVGAKIGMFLGVEAKATMKHEPTKRQVLCMAAINEAKGATMVINRDNLKNLDNYLHSLL